MIFLHQLKLNHIITVKRRIILITLVIITSCTLYAQRAETEKVDTKIKLLPLRPLPIEVKKYNYKVINATQLALPLTEELQGYFVIPGFEFSSSDPDVTVLIYLDKYDEKFLTPPVRGINETKYAYGISSALTVRLSFLTGDKRFEFYQTSKLLKEDDTRYGYQSTYTYATEAAAIDAGKKDETMFKDAKQMCLSKTLSAVQRYLKETHGYSEIELTIPVWSMKAKSFDYSDMDEAQSKTILGLKGYSGVGLNDENKKLFQEAVTIWENVLKEYNPDDKKARINPKNVGVLFGNLALTNGWLKNDQEALKYIDLLSKSRGSGSVDMISEIVNPDIKGREQDAKRNNNALIIEKTKSAFYVSPDFEVKGHMYRINSLQKNNFLNKHLPNERRIFEYQENGLLSKTYSESYNAGTKTWEKRRNVHTIMYDHDNSVMYVYGDKSSTVPILIRRFKDGKLVYQKSYSDVKNVNDSTVAKLFYNPSGQLERYVINPHFSTPDAEVKYQYANGQMIRKEIFTSKGGVLKVYSKIEYEWNSGKLMKENRFTMGNDEKYPEKPSVKQYHYDGRGFLVGLDYVGYETETFTLDEAGNILEIHAHADDGGSKMPTQIWERGTGNALLYTMTVSSSTGPEEFPSLY